MAGSSGIFFARAAYETGMISRGRLARDVYENLRFRLRGSTDDRADDVRKRVGEMIAGVRVRDLERLSPRVLSGVLPRLYPQMLERAYAHQDAGVPVYILTAASQEMADLLARVLAFDGGLGSRSEVVDGRYTGRPAGPFNYREGKVALDARGGRARGHRPGRPPTPTRTPSPTCRCCAPCATPSSSTPTPALRRIALEEGWEVIELDRLGRRLKLLGGARRRHRAGRSLGRVALGRGRSRPALIGACAVGDLRPAAAQPAAKPAMSSAAPPAQSKIRVVVAKPGLDGHDRGAKIIARALRDAGMEVIYTGLHQTPEQIVETVIQEDADAVGLSILSGAHMTLVPRVVELLREQGVEDVVITVGGTIPAEDIPELKRLGVAEVFTPGAPTQAIVDFIRGATAGQRRRRASAD